MDDLRKDQHDFLRHGPGPAPAPGDALLREVRDDLSPSPTRVFFKMAVLHSAASLLTLSVCPQFGFRLLGEGMGLMHLFMRFGELGCFAACGAFFLGSSLLLAGGYLRGEELRLIRRHRWLGPIALAALSLGFFFMLDAAMSVRIAVAWMLGALLAGELALAGVWNWRKLPHFPGDED